MRGVDAAAWSKFKYCVDNRLHVEFNEACHSSAGVLSASTRSIATTTMSRYGVETRENTRLTKEKLPMAHVCGRRIYMDLLLICLPGVTFNVFHYNAEDEHKLGLPGVVTLTDP